MKTWTGNKGDICSNETMYQIKSSWSRMNITGLEFRFIMILPLWIIAHMSSGHVLSYDVKIDLFCSKVSLTWHLLRFQLSCNLQNSHYWQLKTMHLFVCSYFYSTQALLPHSGQLLHKCSFHCYRLQLAPWTAWAHSPGMLLHCQCFSWLSFVSKIVGARPGVSPMQVLVLYISF